MPLEYKTKFTTVALPLKGEITLQDFWPQGFLSAWDTFKYDFISPMHHLFCDILEEGQVADAEEIAAKHEFADFMSTLSGPYHVMIGYGGKEMHVTLLHPADRLAFARQFPDWTKNDDNTLHNTQYIVRQMLAGYRGESPGMRELLQTVGNHFLASGDKLDLMAGALYNEERLPLDKQQQAEAVQKLVGFVRAAILAVWPSREERRPFVDHGLDI